jgi:hypothetical protein
MYSVCEWENDLKVKAVNCQKFYELCEVYVTDLLDQHFFMAVVDWK